MGRVGLLRSQGNWEREGQVTVGGEGECWCEGEKVWGSDSEAHRIPAPGKCARPSLSAGNRDGRADSESCTAEVEVAAAAAPVASNRSGPPQHNRSRSVCSSWSAGASPPPPPPPTRIRPSWLEAVVYMRDARGNGRRRSTCAAGGCKSGYGELEGKMSQSRRKKTSVDVHLHV